MRWDASDHAGFTTGEPWLPVGGSLRLRPDEGCVVTLRDG